MEAEWIGALFKDKDVHYTADIHKKAVNVVDNIAMTFYDEYDVFMNTKTVAITKELFKITHT